MRARNQRCVQGRDCAALGPAGSYDFSPKVLVCCSLRNSHARSLALHPPHAGPNLLCHQGKTERPVEDAACSGVLGREPPGALCPLSIAVEVVVRVIRVWKWPVFFITPLIDPHHEDSHGGSLHQRLGVVAQPPIEEAYVIAGEVKRVSVSKRSEIAVGIDSAEVEMVPWPHHEPLAVVCV